MSCDRISSSGLKNRKMRTIFVFLQIIFSTVIALPANNHKDYKKAVHLSLLFYEAQRSGKLPEDNRISWRGDSALNDRGELGEDLTGGYYDTADFVKFGLPIAYTITVLSWGMISYKKAYLQIEEYKNALDAIKWGTDYLMKCHVGKEEFYAQVGDFLDDHKFWGRPEDLNMTRKSYKIDIDRPGSDIAGEASAALAAASIVFRDMDKSYSDLLLKHSRELFDFATKYRGLYHDAHTFTKPYYENEDYGDELTWAALWLYKATNLTKYEKLALEFYKKYDMKELPNTFFYNNKNAGVRVLIAQEFKSKTNTQAVQDFCDNAIKNEQRTPRGLVFINKLGTLAHAANIAFICLQAKELELDYVKFAKQQLDYILGTEGFSYQVGYGAKYPTQPHHASSSCKNVPAPCGWDDYKSLGPNPQILYGALVSGPTVNDYYEDTREEFLYNEVTIDYNAGFQSLMVGLIQLELL